MERLVATVARAMSEQATATTQITTAAESMRIQTEQAAKRRRNRRGRLPISAALPQHCEADQTDQPGQPRTFGRGGGISDSLGEIKGITERNASGAKETVNRTNGLLNNARRLTEMAEMLSVAGKSKSGNGRRAQWRSPGEPAETLHARRKRKS